MRNSLFALVCCSVLFITAHAADDIRHPFLRRPALVGLELGDEKFLLMANSIGNLTRLGQAVIIGEIVNQRVDANFLDELHAREGRWPLPAYWLSVKVVDVIHGNEALKGKTIEVEVPWQYLPPLAEFSGYMFLSKRVLERTMSLRNVRYSIDSLPRGERGDYEFDHWVLLGGTLGAITGDDAKLEHLKEYTYAFWHWYRGSITNFTVLADLLTQMSNADYERLRNDASADLALLYRSLSRDKLLAIMADDELSDWARQKFKKFDERWGPRPPRSREEVEQIFYEHHFDDLIASDDIAEIREGYKILWRFSPRDLEYHRDLWEPAIRALLNHPERDIRLLAAGRLATHFDDMVGVPIFLEALRDPYWQRMGIVRSLQRATGQEFPLDADAPEDVREEQIRRWEEWWADESAREE